jgi:hypothetical protein
VSDFQQDLASLGQKVHELVCHSWGEADTKAAESFIAREQWDDLIGLVLRKGHGAKSELVDTVGFTLHKIALFGVDHPHYDSLHLALLRPFQEYLDAVPFMPFTRALAILCSSTARRRGQAEIDWYTEFAFEIELDSVLVQFRKLKYVPSEEACERMKQKLAGDAPRTRQASIWRRFGLEWEAVHLRARLSAARSSGETAIHIPRGL